jgi:hypothetical protein
MCVLYQRHRRVVLQSENSLKAIGAGRRAGLSRRYPYRVDAKAVAESHAGGVASATTVRRVPSRWPPRPAVP